jgi:hypothetical protein
VIALPLRQLVSPSRAGDGLSCCSATLMTAAKTPKTPITTLAGYVARDTGWEGFEVDVEQWFNEFNVNVLHAKQLHDTDGEFAGWSEVDPDFGTGSLAGE